MSADPHDQLLLIRGAVAEYGRTLIAERTRRGRRAKLRAGTRLTRELKISSAVGAARGGRHPPGMGQRPHFAFASGVAGVKRLTRPPSGSRRITERCP